MSHPGALPRDYCMCRHSCTCNLFLKAQCNSVIGISGGYERVEIEKGISIGVCTEGVCSGGEEEGGMHARTSQYTPAPAAPGSKHDHNRAVLSSPPLAKVRCALPAPLLRLRGIGNGDHATLFTEPECPENSLI